MPRGRFISKALFGSKKVARLPERTVLVYVAMVLNADAEGKLEADDESLLTYGARYALAHSWTEETVAADREAIRRVGLIETWGEAGDICAEIVQFREHNRIRPDREAPSRIARPASGRTTSASSRRTPGVVRERSGSTPSQGEGEGEDQGEGEVGRRSTTAVDPDVTNRLLKAWRVFWDRANRGRKKKIAPPPLTIDEATRLARDVPALEFFPRVDDLADELRRIAGIFDEKGWSLFRARPVIEKVGQTFEGVREPEPRTFEKKVEPGAVHPDVAKRLGGLDGITKEIE